MSFLVMKCMKSAFPYGGCLRSRKRGHLYSSNLIDELQRIETVKGMRVTPILGAYHLPAKERPRTTALVKWSKLL
jgi:hypothetical protein